MDFVMPVIRRPLSQNRKSEPQYKSTPVTPMPTEILPTFLTKQQVQERLACSKHEVRRMVDEGVLKLIPYLGGRAKPWRFSESQVIELAKRQIAQALAA
jgi:hypothetical protein